MATNETTRKYADILVPIGTGADEKPAFLTVGELLVTDWGRDKPQSWDVVLCLTHFNPVLYQQVLKANGGKATVLCKKADHSKKYKTAVEVQEPSGAETPPDETTADVGHE